MLLRLLVVAVLLALNGLVIYFGGSSVGFTSSLVTVILIVVFLAWSFAREGVWSDRKGPDGPDAEGIHEGDDMVHRSRARPP